MYKLRVISGPKRGTSWEISEGENSIGRASDNVVVLPSAKVSKRHCVLVVNGDEIEIQDQNSSNGTFINGALTRKKPIQAGDRISVGEYVLQLVRPSAPNFSNQGFQAGLPLAPVIQHPSALLATGGESSLPLSEVPAAEEVPKDLKGRLTWFFDRKFMPFFYQLNFKTEWRFLVGAIFGIFVLLNLFVSVYPLVQSNQDAILREVGKRARAMAKQIAERNTQALSAQMETKTEIGSVGYGEGVRMSLLVDLENRILAPGSKFNQYLTSGVEAVEAVKARELFRSGRETGIVKIAGSDTVVAIEPVKVLSAITGSNVVVAMAVVSIDSALSVPSMGEVGLAYSETFIVVGLFAALLLLILYRLTLKPMTVLGEDLDKALKGDLTQVTREFRFEEMNAIYDRVNSALQRIPRSNGSGELSSAAGNSEPSLEEIVAPAKMLGELGLFALVICDGERKVFYSNSVMEEISGIRADEAVGQELSSVARDQAFASFVKDLFERASVGGDPIGEDYEFSGVSYRVSCAAFGPWGGAARAYLLAASKRTEMS